MKTLEYYMKLPYTVEIRNIPEEEGGGVSACIPQLGRHAFSTDGETVQEALDRLQTLKEELFSDYLEKGVPIPEPEQEAETFSGKFLVRMPKSLHRELVVLARKEGASLNQLVCTLLAGSVQSVQFKDRLEKYGKMLDMLSERVDRLWSRVDSMARAAHEYYGTRRRPWRGTRRGSDYDKAA